VLQSMNILNCVSSFVVLLQCLLNCSIVLLLLVNFYLYYYDFFYFYKLKYRYRNYFQ